MLKNIISHKIFNIKLIKRNYSANKKLHIKRRVFIQDVSKLPVYEYSKSRESKKRLYVWGLSETGALGVNKSLKKHSERQTAFVQHPTRHTFGEKYDIINACCGYGFSLFAVKPFEGISLFGTGINTDSQLGYHIHRGKTNKPIELVISPIPIEFQDKIEIIDCAAGRAHSIVLSSEFNAYTFGNNAYGQCGRKVISEEDYSSNCVIHKITNIPECIKSVTCGQDHTMFITSSGKVYSCGWGADGQTGLGHYRSTETPTLVQGDISTEIITKIACSGDCVLALSEKGEVFGWGNSEYSQLKCSDDIQQISTPQILDNLKGIGRIVDIASGGSFCMVLNESGEVFIWGYGILGFGPNVDHVKIPTKIPSTLFGRNDFNPNSTVTSIYSGLSHLGAINTEGDLFMWGKNKHGCLGLGQTKDQYFPFKAAVGAQVEKIYCGVDHTLAICKGFI